jgi:hypothetical protein
MAEIGIVGARGAQRVGGARNANSGEGVRRAVWSVAPYVGGPKPREANMCSAEDNTCKAFKAKGTDLCIGHLRALEKEAAE